MNSCVSTYVHTSSRSYILASLRNSYTLHIPTFMKTRKETQTWTQTETQTENDVDAVVLCCLSLATCLSQLRASYDASIHPPTYPSLRQAGRGSHSRTLTLMRSRTRPNLDSTGQGILLTREEDCCCVYCLFCCGDKERRRWEMLGVCSVSS